jgi:hypothetical protein
MKSLALVSLVAACGGLTVAPDQPVDNDARSFFYENIASFVQTKCSACHGDTADSPLLSYDAIIASASEDGTFDPKKADLIIPQVVLIHPGTVVIDGAVWTAPELALITEWLQLEAEQR